MRDHPSLGKTNKHCLPNQNKLTRSKTFIIINGILNYLSMSGEETTQFSILIYILKDRNIIVKPDATHQL